MALSGCTSTADKQAIERIEADARARLEADAAKEKTEKAAAEEERQKQIKARQEWLNSAQTQKYIQSLCSMPPGAERDKEYDFAWETYGIIVSEDKERADAASNIGMPVTICPSPSSPASSHYQIPVG